MELQAKMEKIKEYLKDKEGVVAFSGGADSSLLAYIALDAV